MTGHVFASPLCTQHHTPHTTPPQHASGVTAALLHAVCLFADKHTHSCSSTRAHTHTHLFVVPVKEGQRVYALLEQLPQVGAHQRSVLLCSVLVGSVCFVLVGCVGCGACLCWWWFIEWLWRACVGQRLLVWLFVMALVIPCCCCCCVCWPQLLRFAPDQQLPVSFLTQHAHTIVTPGAAAGLAVHTQLLLSRHP